MMNSEPHHHRSKSKERYHDRRDDHSNHTYGGIWSVITVTKKQKHIKRYCKELTKYLEGRKIFESQETSNSTNIVDENFEIL